MNITKAYLMWVGAQHYATIQDYSDEVAAQGISKRLPNADVAAALMEEGTVVFLAHDEGEYRDCPECQGEMECPECRKRIFQLDNLINDVTNLSNSTEEDACQDSDEKTIWKKNCLFIRKDRQLREKIQKLEKEIKGCDLCKDKKIIEGGTGGTVVVHGGEVWDFRRYNYWLHQGTFVHSVEMEQPVQKNMCEHCGGTGKMPCGKVFGLFLPSAIEYIMNANESKEVKEEMKRRGFNLLEERVVALEPERGCGKRHPGGLYAVTSPKDNTTETKKLVKELVAKGIISPEVEVAGNFIRFLKPVEITEKRFRGIKRWDLNPQVEDEAQMIVEAVE